MYKRIYSLIKTFSPRVSSTTKVKEIKAPQVFDRSRLHFIMPGSLESESKPQSIIDFRSKLNQALLLKNTKDSYIQLKTFINKQCEKENEPYQIASQVINNGQIINCGELYPHNEDGQIITEPRYVLQYKDAEKSISINEFRGERNYVTVAKLYEDGAVCQSQRKNKANDSEYYINKNKSLDIEAFATPIDGSIVGIFRFFDILFSGDLSSLKGKLYDSRNKIVESGQFNDQGQLISGSKTLADGTKIEGTWDNGKLANDGFYDIEFSSGLKLEKVQYCDSTFSLGEFDFEEPPHYYDVKVIGESGSDDLNQIFTDIKFVLTDISVYEDSGIDVKTVWKDGVIQRFHHNASVDDQSSFPRSIKSKFFNQVLDLRNYSLEDLHSPAKHLAGKLHNAVNKQIRAEKRTETEKKYQRREQKEKIEKAFRKKGLSVQGIFNDDSF